LRGDRLAGRPLGGIALLAVEAGGAGEADRQLGLLPGAEAVDDRAEVAVQLAPAAQVGLALGLVVPRRGRGVEGPAAGLRDARGAVEEARERLREFREAVLAEQGVVAAVAQRPAAAGAGRVEVGADLLAEGH